MIGITFGATVTGRFIRMTGRYKFVPMVELERRRLWRSCCSSA